LKPQSLYPRGKSPRRLVLKTVLDDVERRKMFPLPGLELLSLARPASSHTLYRLRYRLLLEEKVFNDDDNDNIYNKIFCANIKGEVFEVSE
jgi:hypothetical protein